MTFDKLSVRINEASSITQRISQSQPSPHKRHPLAEQT